MSRCFPYPPPYYGQAQIESIKLQKKIESSTKNEEREKSRKKHKREDKQKLISSDADMRNHKKKTSEDKKRKKSKHEENLFVQNKYAQKISNEVTEHLERSGLTEDHELPCSTQYNFDSPESSLDSNKRRKVARCVPIHKTHGTILRIKLPSSKQTASEPPLLSSRQMESDPPFTLSRSRKPDPPFLLSRQGKPEMPLPSMRQVKPVQPLPSLRQIKSRLSLPTSRQIELELPFSPSRQVESKLPLPSSTQVKSKLALPSSRQIKSELPGPSSQMKSDLPLPLSSQVNLELPLPSLRQKDSQKLFMQIPMVKMQSAADEQPCPSGRGAETTLGQVASVSLHKTSSSKRTRSKDRQNEKFRELTVNWKALALQADSLDIDDQWLMDAPKRDISHTNECKASTEALACRNYELSSQQPLAYYVPEFDMYQLPYVLPY